MVPLSELESLLTDLIAIDYLIKTPATETA
jgi:hypothetical protein